MIHHFIVPLLAALGWPTNDLNRFNYEQHTPAGKPDITLIPQHGGKIYLGAKRLTVIEELEVARTTARGVVLPGQLALPGMAVDCTREEQQAINYAFENGGTWAILSNFEKLLSFRQHAALDRSRLDSFSRPVHTPFPIVVIDTVMIGKLVRQALPLAARLRHV